MLTTLTKTRSVGWADEARRVLRITQDGSQTLFVVEKDDEAFGEAYMLHKVGTGERHDVQLSGPEESCTCGDCVYRQRRCRHLLALHAMKKAGRLS